MRSGYPEHLVITGLVQDGKCDRDGGEGKDSGPEQVLWNKDRGVETTRVQWLDLAWGSCRLSHPPPCTLHAAPTHEGCQWGQEHLTAKGCQQLSTEGSAS